MPEPKVFYQLWCDWERDDRWAMEGFFREPQHAQEHLNLLRDDPETPSMPDWAIVKVEGWW